MRGNLRRAAERRIATALGALFAALFALSAAISPARAETPAPSPITLEAVMQRLASSPGFRADFREVREISLLRDPLESAGTLYFVPPDRLARHTHTPEPGLMLIEGDRLRTRDALGEEELDLAAHPRARRLVDQLTLLLRGDLPALRDAYEADFEAAGSGWSLVLVPRDVVAREIIGRISLHGEGEELLELRVVDASGDRTRTLFRNVDPRHRFGEDELHRAFPES